MKIKIEDLVSLVRVASEAVNLQGQEVHSIVIPKRTIIEIPSDETLSRRKEVLPKDWLGSLIVGHPVHGGDFDEIAITLKDIKPKCPYCGNEVKNER